MNRIRKLTLLLLISICFIPFKVDAKTIKEFENEVNSYARQLEEKEAKIAKNDQEVAEIKKNIASYEKQISDLETSMKSLQDEIDKSNAEIEKKSEESKQLFQYLQVSNGNNAYMEYIFGAESVTEMVYRLSIVEQLTEYNQKVMNELDELINLESLSINLTFKDNKTDKITFNLGIYNELNYAWNIEPDIIQINTNYNNNLNLNFLNQNKYQELLNNLNSSNLNNNISYSIVTEKLYRLYEPVKVYLSNYTEKPLPNCIHDLNDYKKYYTYYERYYIEIKDDVTSNENIILNTNIPLNEIEVITKEDFIILKYKHDTFYKKINKPKEENNSKKIVKVVNKQPTTKKNNYIPSTTKEVITTTKNTIQDQPKEKHISYIYSYFNHSLHFYTQK